METGHHEQHHFDFVGKVGIFGGVSLILVVASLLYLMVHGITWGIDFKGGTEMQVKFASPVVMDEVRKVTGRQHLINTELQAFGAGDEYVIRFQTEVGKSDKETNENIKSAINGLKEDIQKTFVAQNPEIRRVDSVGPQVGAELKRNGYLAVFYCLLVILIYVGLRFDYNYSLGAVVCLFHDAVITLAIFVLVGKEVNVPIMAAIMTLIGYSLNDTIVVFDRIRETEHLYKDKGYTFIINLAINNMLERTLITSGTVFTSAICLWLFADGTVSDIAFALTVGIIFGTYSSIYVASPFIILLEKFKMKRG
jgi:preprotein translocase subunit SecF